MKAAKWRRDFGRRRRRLGIVAAGALLGVTVGVVAFVAISSTGGGGKGSGGSVGAVETKSEKGPAEPFQGGPRLYFPVDSVDLGQVPFNTNVSYAFDLSNVGDAPVKIEGVQVEILEGC